MFHRHKIALAIGCATAALTLAAVPSFASTDDSMTATTTAENAPLIPRDALFGNPTRAGGQISPDGKWLVKSVVNGRQMTAEVPFAESNWDAYYKNVYRHLQGRAKLAVTAESAGRNIGVLHAASIPDSRNHVANRISHHNRKSLLPERNAEMAKKRPSLGIRSSAGHHRHVHPCHAFDGVVVHLGENCLVLNTQGVVASSIKRFLSKPTKISDSWNRNINQPI